MIACLKLRVMTENGRSLKQEMKRCTVNNSCYTSYMSRKFLTN